MTDGARLAREAAERADFGRAPAADPGALDQQAMLVNARRAAEFLKALSHEARLIILCLLADGEKSVIDLERMLGLRQPAVSQQLARLRADNLVGSRRDGKNVYYSLATPEVKAVITALHAAFCAPGDSGRPP